jgi:hypothetical protein
MVQLDAVKKQAPKKSSSGKSHPVLPDGDGILAKHVTNAISCSEQIETLESSLEQSSGELKSVAQSHFFRTCSGTDNLPSAYIAEGMNGERVQVQLKNQYYPINLATKGSDARIEAIKDVVGEKFDELFRQKFSIEINGDAVPDANAQRFINALVGVCNLFCHQPDAAQADAHEGAMGDVESILMLHEYPPCEVLTAKESLAPRASFHTERHHALSADQNLELNKHMQVGTTLKIKGVK